MPSMDTPKLVERVNDPRLQWTRLRAVRRASALVLAACCAVFAFGVVTDRSLVLLVAALVAMGAITVLNYGTRGLMELPAELLDERQRELRDRCQVLGLRLVQALVPVALTVVALLVAGDADPRVPAGVAVALVPLVALTSRLSSAWVLQDEDAEEAHELAVRAEDVPDQPDGRSRFLRTAALYGVAGGVFGVATSRITELLVG